MKRALHSVVAVALASLAPVAWADEDLIRAQDRAAEAREDLRHAQRRADRAEDRLRHSRYQPRFELAPAPNYAAMEAYELSGHRSALGAQYGEIVSVRHAAAGEIDRLIPALERARADVEALAPRAQAARVAIEQAIEADPEWVEARRSVDALRSAVAQRQEGALGELRATPTYRAVERAFGDALFGALDRLMSLDFQGFAAAMDEAQYLARSLEQFEAEYVAGDPRFSADRAELEQKEQALGQVRERVTERVGREHPAAAELAVYERVLGEHDRLAAALDEQQYHVEYADRALDQVTQQLADIDIRLANAAAQARYQEQVEEFRRQDDWRRAQWEHQANLNRLRRARMEEDRAEEDYYRARERQEREARKTHVSEDPPSYRSDPPSRRESPGAPAASGGGSSQSPPKRDRLRESRNEPNPQPAPQRQPENRPQVRSEPKPQPKPEAKPQPKPAPRQEDKPAAPERTRSQVSEAPPSQRSGSKPQPSAPAQKQDDGKRRHPRGG